MTEYINKQALLAEYDCVHVGPPGGARKLIEEAPPADVAPVVHGRWEPKRKMYRTPNAKNYTCSECGLPIAERWHYCPNCGAHMKDGE